MNESTVFQFCKKCGLWHYALMKILFITSSRIGDAVLSTGLLNYMAQKWPDAKVTIACGALAASLFEGYPNLQQIIPMRKEKFNGHWAKLWTQVIRTRWDMVVDLRNSAVSRLVFTDQRYGFGSHIDRTRHKAEQNAAVMELNSTPELQLWFTEEQQARAREFIPDGGPVIGVGPAANWRGKTWPAERFIEVVKFLRARTGVMPAARVAVFAAPGEEEAAYAVLESVPPEARLDLIAKGNPGTAAAAIARVDFYLGNDSGLMHCAAAIGVPTLGLFGPSYPHLYRPWGPRADYIRTPETFDELVSYQGYDPATAPSLMQSLTVDAVKEKIESFLAELQAA
jgi:heptosyltransferase-3